MRQSHWLLTLVSLVTGALAVLDAFGDLERQDADWKIIGLAGLVLVLFGLFLSFRYHFWRQVRRELASLTAEIDPQEGFIDRD